MTDLENEYARLAAEHTQHIDANDAPAANQAFNQLTHARAALRRESDGGRAMLDRLIAHKLDAVRVHAATDLLITDPKAAMPVLQEISQGKRGAARIMAGAALYALQRGSFKEKLDELTGEDRA
ncbi:MAG: DUF2019 domain-containing protein [Caulobacterales bacterium]|nr:DUF2019 domain-containing protein [Caulobacterales bacterium]